MILILLTLLAAGIAGGACRCVISYSIESEESVRPVVVNLVTGIMASFLVPTLLWLLHSDLIASLDVENPPKNNYLILFGISSLAACSGFEFIKLAAATFRNKLNTLAREINESNERVEQLAGAFVNRASAHDIVNDRFKANGTDTALKASLEIITKKIKNQQIDYINIDDIRKDYPLDLNRLEAEIRELKSSGMIGEIYVNGERLIYLTK